jgi:hypothetical protein
MATKRTENFENHPAEEPSGSPQPSLTFRVAPRGGVSIYGLGRFPTTLYMAQWLSILAEAERLHAFILEHSHELR